MTTRKARSFACSVALVGLALGLLFATSASASKQVISYFGTDSHTGTLGGEFGGEPVSVEPNDIAVNWTGAGSADAGDLYVVDPANNRIQRFAQDDNGTPANPYDDSYPFISAWGADVDGSTSGGNAYEICTVAASCKKAVGADGNGGLRGPAGVAVDQDTGDVYVIDVGAFPETGNSRVVVYSADGTFLRAFGWDVVESGPGDSGTGYEVCVPADGDVCKAGNPGSGTGQIGKPIALAVSQPDGNSATGTVYVTDEANVRVDTFGLDGTNPGSFGSASQFGAGVEAIAVDSRGIVYIGDTNNQQEIDRYDSQNANGGGIGFLTSIAAPPVLPSGVNGTIGLEVDPDSDAGGPDADTLYVLRTYSNGGVTTSVIQQFGPLNAPGLTAPPSGVDDVHGTLVKFNFTKGLGLDASNGRLFVASFSNTGGAFDSGGEGFKSGVYVLDTAGGEPSASLDSVSDVTASSAVVHGTVTPNGGPPVSYHLEYSLDGTSWRSTPEIAVGTQEGPQQIDAVLDPPGTGLEPDTFYHVRLVATKAFTPPVVTAEKTFTTLIDSPRPETVGSPIRTASTARLEGRIDPRGLATSYRFEYGSQGPCATSPCESTPDQGAGSDSGIEFVSDLVSGLQAGTTYHYRLVAESIGGSSAGDDMTVTTRGSDAPLDHGHFPGPPGSDRAWEQVNVADTGGNPVTAGYAYSDSGERAIYQIPGGTSITDSGSAFNQFFAERTADGWQSRQILPSRDQVAGPNWLPPFTSSDLSRLVSLNANLTSGQRSFWRLQPEGAPAKLFDVPNVGYGSFLVANDDASRIIVYLIGPADPAHPVPPKARNLYDISSGEPQLVSLLPGGGVPACGAGGSKPGYGLPAIAARRTTHWLSADGSLLVFPSEGNTCSDESQLYLRDIPAETTARVSKPPVSGLACGAGFLKSTPGAVFFWTKARLAVEDSAPINCGGTADQGDVYRYEIGSDTLECLTCFAPGLDADVDFSQGSEFGGGFPDRRRRRRIPDLFLLVDAAASRRCRPRRLPPGGRNRGPGLCRRFAGR